MVGFTPLSERFDPETVREIMAHAGYGRLCHQRGQSAEARHHLTQALEIFERLGTQLEPERARETLRDLA